MSKFRVLRPIEVDGTLYKPKPGLNETIPKTTKSAGDGREISVNHDGLIELSSQEATGFTLGQLETAGPMEPASASDASQLAPAVESATSAKPVPRTTMPATGSARQEDSDSAPAKPVSPPFSKQIASAKPAARKNLKTGSNSESASAAHAATSNEAGKPAESTKKG
jgi:hypothetical protein